MESFSSWFWAESFWLPPGKTWQDLKSTESIRRPQPEDLYIVLPLALLLLVIRFLFERFIARPFCGHIGIEDKPRKEPEPNVICEKVFKTVSKTPDDTVIKGLCKQLGWTDHQVRLWFSRRRNISKLPVMRKATESCWRFLFYILAFIYGLCCLLPKDWFLHSRRWFEGYLTHHNLEVEIKWYYIVELAFYVSLLSSVLIDNKRKDFWEMTIHHFVTILLIWGSYCIGHFRIGAVIMCVHDSSDYWLESAKVFNYAKMQRTCDCLFVGFALSFFLSRWVTYPFWVLRTFFKSPEIVGPFQSFYWFAALLCLLQPNFGLGDDEESEWEQSENAKSIGQRRGWKQGTHRGRPANKNLYASQNPMVSDKDAHSLLHIIWGFAVGRVVYTFTISGKVDRDVRSEDEDEDAVEEIDQNNLSKKKK